ncbi:multidrug efflux SMR transporter [Meiothermus sp. CFH 77666]|uniref:DMT family transporter n=1 Tax=Meiothermus sp. CFH 77666 TaxID=2817942 RepID=UPI001AA08DEA|nr:multidrug efflux SMR transporter [Meiothermus sp. CFH 77666]MBO1436790.1 multidrug efflux SMR transporter [Meiothermus sp. CFH 77666]
MAWALLILSGLFEVAFTTLMKLSDGFKKPLPTLGFFVFAPLSLGILSHVLLTIPVGTAYAVWTGIGAFGTALVGIFFFKDPVNRGRLFFLTTLILSVIELRVFGGA